MQSRGCHCCTLWWGPWGGEWHPMQTRGCHCCLLWWGPWGGEWHPMQTRGCHCCTLWWGSMRGRMAPNAKPRVPFTPRGCTKPMDPTELAQICLLYQCNKFLFYGSDLLSSSNTIMTILAQFKKHLVLNKNKITKAGLEPKTSKLTYWRSSKWAI